MILSYTLVHALSYTLLLTTSLRCILLFVTPFRITLSHTFSLSLSPSHFLAFTFSFSHSHFLPLSFSRSHSPTLIHPLTFFPSLSLSPPLSLPPPLPLSPPSLSPSLSGDCFGEAILEVLHYLSREIFPRVLFSPLHAKMVKRGVLVYETPGGEYTIPSSALPYPCPYSCQSHTLSHTNTSLYPSSLITIPSPQRNCCLARTRCVCAPLGVVYWRKSLEGFKAPPLVRYMHNIHAYTHTNVHT